ncbi:MAG: cytochrome P460 family protein [Pseudomonadota bacterium]
MIRRAAISMVLFLGGGAALAAGPKFTGTGELVRPTDYREWIFLASGLGMTYGPNRPQAGQAPAFDNAFVNPESYRAFMKTGRWPEGTMFMLEIRSADENVSINAGGRTQGALRAIEASVKDTKRYPDGGWSYFSFDGPQGLKESAAPFPRTASCYGCHSRNGAVEWTFTQFYPSAFEVARKLGTVRPDYDPARKAE